MWMYELGRGAYWNIDFSTVHANEAEVPRNLIQVLVFYQKWIYHVRKGLGTFVLGTCHVLGKDVVRKIASLVWETRDDPIWYRLTN